MMDVFSVLGWLSWWQWWLLSIVLAIAVYLKYMCWHFKLFTSQGIPVPIPPKPILGTLGKDEMDVSKSFTEKFGNHKTVGTFLGRTPRLVTIDPEIIREVFIKDSKSFAYRSGMDTGDDITENSMAMMKDSNHWKYLRSTLTPAFSSGKLKKMIPQMNTCSTAFAAHLAKQGQKAFEIKQYAGAYSMDVIARIAFGLDIDSAANPRSPFVIHGKNGFDFKFTNPVIILNMFMPFLTPVLKLLKTQPFNHDAINFFTDVTSKILEARKDENARVDFMQLMMNAHQEEGNKSARRMTKEEVVSQSVMFFIGGYDTTAIAISFLAYNLAITPEKQDILLEEVDRVVGEKESITDEELQKMPYLDMCVSETLRLYPPIIMADRRASEGVVVKGIRLPADACINVPTFLMHRHPEYYPDPDEFIPERFSSEEKSARDPMTYMPFGAGPRMCIATRLALMEIKIAILAILKTHRLMRAPETEVPIKLKTDQGMVHTHNGIWLSLEQRKN